MADFDSGWARVISREDEFHGKVGKFICEEIEPSGTWITLEIDGVEILFERWEVMPCPAPLARPTPKGDLR